LTLATRSSSHFYYFQSLAFNWLFFCLTSAAGCKSSSLFLKQTKGSLFILMLKSWTGRGTDAVADNCFCLVSGREREAPLWAPSALEMSFGIYESNFVSEAAHPRACANRFKLSAEK
jgi:hypothetical protein